MSFIRFHPQLEALQAKGSALEKSDLAYAVRNVMWVTEGGSDIDANTVGSGTNLRPRVNIQMYANIL
jgi:hypothetical protein